MVSRFAVMLAMFFPVSSPSYTHLFSKYRVMLAMFSGIFTVYVTS